MPLESLSKFAGTWVGQKRLWLTPDDPVRISDSRAWITTVVRDHGLVLRYTWEDAGKAHAGILLVQQHGKTRMLTAAWTDSWHQADELMVCRGVPDPNEHVEVRGSYSDCGWAIALDLPAPDALVLRMFNITPDGRRTLAVEAAYNRSSATD